MKKILAIMMAMVMVLALTVAVAADYVEGPLTIDNFGTSGWSSSYDPATKTINFEGDWTGRGWWIGTDAPLFGYDSIKIAFPNGAQIDAQVNVQYVGPTGGTDDGDTITTQIAAGDTEVVVELNPEAGIFQIYIQCHAAGDLTLGEVTMQVAGTGAANEPEGDNSANEPEPSDSNKEETSNDVTTAPNTGLALAVVPAIVAMAAVAVSKKR